MPLAEAVVVVLGGSSGMGLATAQRAAAEGARVTLVGRDPDKLKSAASEVGPGTRTFSGDTRDEAFMHELFADHDGVDHVASFVGDQPAAPVGETTHELFASAMDARVWSAMNACRFAAPRMGPTGSFTFCSGVSAHRPRPNRGAGAAATAALESFTRAMAVELAPIRANAVCPGAIRTPVLDRFFGQQRDTVMDDFAASLPAGRIGEPDEIADAVIFLMGNGYVTGITLRVDGGALLR